jgi:hypothetical protein
VGKQPTPAPRFDLDGNPIAPGPAFGTARHQDATRQAEDEQRKADLAAGAKLGTAPHEAMSAFAEAWDTEVEKYAVQTDAPSAGDVIDSAIGTAVAEAGERVEAVNLDPEVKLAKAIARELKGQVLETDAGDIYVEGSATPEETAQLEAELASDEDELIGTDEEGRDVYRDSNTGVEYVYVQGE